MPGRRIVLLITLWLVGLPVLAAALSPSFERRTWTRADGAPQSAYGMAQDADGLLWFATTTGLYSYDGARFTRVDTVYGHPLRSNNVVTVLATADGIAVGYQFGGVSVFSRARARHYTVADGLPAGSVASLAVDADKKFYAGTFSGVAVLDPASDRWAHVPRADDRIASVREMSVDAGGTLWAVIGAQLYARPRGAAALRHVLNMAYSYNPVLVEGKLVVYTDGNELVEPDLAGAHRPWRITPAFTRDATLFAGPHGTVWAWLERYGTTLLRRDASGRLVVGQTFDGAADPGRMASRALVDREGNLWVATLDGVERYRQRRLHALPLSAPLPSWLVGNGLGERVWVAGGNDGPVWEQTGAGIERLPRLQGVTAMYRQDASSVWLGGTSGMFHVTPDGTRHWPMPAGLPKNYRAQAMAGDAAGNLWVAIVRNGLFRFHDGIWTKLETQVEGGDVTPISMLRAGAGHVLLGFTGGRIGELKAGGVRLIARDTAAGVGNVLSLIEVDGRLLAGGDRGVGWVEDGAVRPLLPERMAAFLGISGMAVDRQGDLWLHGPDGLFHVTASELRRAHGDGTARVRWEVFNFEDGLRGQVAQLTPLPTLSVAADGKMYYATNSQVGWIDPASIPRNPLPPRVFVQGMRTDAGDLPVTPGMTLAAGTTGIDIRFAATALSMPERVRFRYRLSGVDSDWQEARAARAARYTNLGPGRYRFHVIAANEDGVWNEQGAELEFGIAPTLWQNHWFRAGMVLLAALALLALYRWRMAAVARRAAERAAARLEERERIARNLHDNLLQGVQGFILRCHAVLMRLPQGTPEERALGDALARADQLVAETRDEVMNLRGAAILPRLTGGLRESVEAIDPTLRERLAMTFTGCIELLEDDVANEIYYVLQEAIANSARHSGATRIDVALHVAPAEAQGSVTDNGIGIPADVAAAGRAGHWGLVGMRERIARIGGTLTVRGEEGGGTVVAFTVPLR
jgi:signal transduction histidine kinase/ligand-binding sensor domain-containing protein